VNLRRSWFALISILLAGPLLWAAIRQVQRGEEALSLLHACVNAHRHVGYSGDVGWERKGECRTVGVRHDSESGRTRYAWKKKGKWPPFTLSRPGSRMGDPAGWCLDEEALLRSYRVQLEGATRHLDRSAQLLIVEPRLAGRPRLEVVVDRATKLPLKVTTFKPDGEIYRVASFSSLEIGPQEVKESRWGSSKNFFGDEVPLEGASAAAGYGIRVPAYLPEGFELRECRVNSRWMGKVWMTFTDGVTAFDLNQSVVPTPAQLETFFQRKMSWERAARMVRMSVDRRLRRALKEGAEGGVAVVRHKRKRMHRTYDLRVDDLEISLTARADFDAEECLRVLRSLRPQ